MKIIYSKHFLERKNLRGIPDGLAETVYWEADGCYKDLQTGTFIAVKRLNFQGKVRDVALTYTRAGDKVILVTLHPLKEGQKENRVKSGRWVKHEPESPLRSGN